MFAFLRLEQTDVGGEVNGLRFCVYNRGMVEVPPNTGIVGIYMPKMTSGKSGKVGKSLLLPCFRETKSRIITHKQEHGYNFFKKKEH